MSALNDNPWVILLSAAIAGYVLYLFIHDYRARLAGAEATGRLPGSTPGTPLAIWIGLTGAALITLLESWGELALGVADEQSTISAFFLLGMIAAGIVEEVIFRGYLVVTGRGKVALVVSIAAFSLLFALLHPHLWSWDDGAFSLNLTTKAWFTTGVLFVNSLFFYFMRFAPFNPNRSLVPCFVAHITSNLVVFGVKSVQGFVAW